MPHFASSNITFTSEAINKGKANNKDDNQMHKKNNKDRLCWRKRWVVGKITNTYLKAGNMTVMGGTYEGRLVSKVGERFGEDNNSYLSRAIAVIEKVERKILKACKETHT